MSFLEQERRAAADALDAAGLHIDAKAILTMPRMYGERLSDGRWGCNTCCNGDRCDDPSHVARQHCTMCDGSGAVDPRPHLERAVSAVQAELKIRAAQAYFPDERTRLTAANEAINKLIEAAQAVAR